MDRFLFSDVDYNIRECIVHTLNMARYVNLKPSAYFLINYTVCIVGMWH